MPYNIYPAVDEEYNFPPLVRKSMSLYEELIEAFAGKQLENDVADHKEDFENPHGVTKAQVGLGNVDDTSDNNKPISITQQEALDLKASLNVADDTDDGLMSASDKVKLDGATATATASTVMLRDSSGRSKVANPVSGTDVANFQHVASHVTGRLPVSYPWKTATDYTFTGGVLVVPLQNGGIAVTGDLTINRSGTSVPLTTSWTVIGNIVPDAARSATLSIKYFSAFFIGVGTLYGYINFVTGDVGVRAASGTATIAAGNIVAFGGPGNPNT